MNSLWQLNLVWRRNRPSLRHRNPLRQAATMIRRNPQVYLDSVKFIGEFQSIKTTNTELSGSGELVASDVVPLSRFVIFRYDFTTGRFATYGGTVSIWGAYKALLTPWLRAGKYILLDGPRCDFWEWCFHGKRKSVHSIYLRHKGKACTLQGDGCAGQREHWRHQNILFK